jgi:hypothetical protein
MYSIDSICQSSKSKLMNIIVLKVGTDGSTESTAKTDWSLKGVLNVKSRIGREEITPIERGLRRRIKGFKELYDFAGYYWGDLSIAHCWSSELTETFLDLNPRPTVTELAQVVYLPGAVITFNSQDQYRHRGYIPDPERPGWMIYNKEEYIKILKHEAQKRQEIMQEIVKKRG